MLHRAAELGTVEELDAAFVVKDASGQKLGRNEQIIGVKYQSIRHTL
jgi:hypothetical protein